MANSPSPDRRDVLRTALYGAAGMSFGASHAAAIDRELVMPSLAQAMAEVDRLSQAQALSSSVDWTWAQTLEHCAQSIEYSMTGYPEPKSVLFQHTVGALAFAAFAARGRMTHGLNEPIPGAKPLSPNLSLDAARARLNQAVASFAAHSGPLKPHFAYGELSKAEYEQAHAMHVANHCSAFDIKPPAA